MKLDGLLRLLSTARIIPRETPVFGFLMNHLDIEYSFAKYSSGTNSINDVYNGMKYSALTVVVR